MAPRKIEFRCLYCKNWNKPIPADMGDKKIKCSVCGKFICYRWCKQTIEMDKRPERITASGLTFY